MITHGNKQISEIVYARKASEGGGAVRLTNIIRGAQVVFGGMKPDVKTWLRYATKAAILASSGVVDGKAVIKATNAYLKALAATDPNKATALAGFINEDPMLVCSLGLQPQGVTMPIRWRVGDGASYILTEYYPTSNFKAVAKIKTLDTLPIYFVFAAANTYDEQNGYLLARSGQYESWYWTIGGAFINNNQYHINTNTVYNIEMIRTRVIINGKNFSVSGNTFTPTYKLAIMALSGGEYMAKNLGYSEHKNYEGDQLVIHLIPFKSATREGMIDLVNATFHPNQGTGHFTDAYTLQDGVTPWTPLNQTT